MKSIVQEASSIAKAIEQGWMKAGQPQEFSIRILEEPQRNFLGLTTRSAKIAIFFSDKTIPQRGTEAPRHVKPQPQQTRPQRQEAPREHVAKEQRDAREREPREREVRREKQPAAPDEVVAPRHQQRHRFQGQWNEAMVAKAHEWLTEVLAQMGRDRITFIIEPQNIYLKITLSEQVLPEKDKEKHLLASLSLLMLETVKKQFKTGLRGHKVVLTHAQ